MVSSHLILRAFPPEPSELDPSLFEAVHELGSEHFTWPEKGAHVLTYLSETDIRELWAEACEREWVMGFLPHPENPVVQSSYGPRGSLASALEQLKSAEPVLSDTLLCNGEVVFSNVILGEGEVFKRQAKEHLSFRLSKALSYFKGVSDLRLTPYTITTGKGSVQRLALLAGMIGQGMRSKSNGLIDVSVNNDPRLTLLAMAPRSVMAYFGIVLLYLLRWPLNPSKLPFSLGLIRCQNMTVEGDDGIHYCLDGMELGTQKLVFELQNKNVRLLRFDGPRCEALSEWDKEWLKLSGVPKGESVRLLGLKPLPFFSHASADEFRDLFSNLRDKAKFDVKFGMLLILSVLIALMGLYANSAPVIIGAMVLAPLMAPIISLGMGLARGDEFLIKTSFKTLSWGIVLSLACSATVAFVMPLDHLTSEILARCRPHLLDLAVAIVSGIAGAYVNSKEELSDGLAGIAIAVALVPPLSVAGIGIGCWDLNVAWGALLLFFTNLIGISFAASLTFMVLGFSPFSLAKHGLMKLLVLLMLITTPLFFSFRDMVLQAQLMERLPRGWLEISGHHLDVLPQHVQRAPVPVVQYRIACEQPADLEVIKAFKSEVQSRLKQDLQLEIEWRLVVK